MMALAFPILTFDTTKLKPTWGYVFDPNWLDPFESVVSVLWKFAWMNRLAGHAVVAHVARRNVDPYAGIAISALEINTKYLARTVRVRLQTVRESIPDPMPARGLSPVLKYCLRCMARGYHSVVHQFGNASLCPIHRTPLETQCRKCGATCDYRIDAKLLDAPFRCANCRQAFSASWTRFAKRRKLQPRERIALTRAFIG